MIKKKTFEERLAAYCLLEKMEVVYRSETYFVFADRYGYPFHMTIESLLRSMKNRGI